MKKKINIKNNIISNGGFPPLKIKNINNKFRSISAELNKNKSDFEINIKENNRIIEINSL
jgi:preprotein translocase subunit SecB